MRTMDTTTLSRTTQSGIRWKRIVLAAFLSELVVIAGLLAIIMTHRFLIAPGLTPDQYNEFGQLAGYYAAAPLAGVATFLLTIWAVRGLETRIVTNGLLVGVTATVLTAGFIFGARPEDRFMYGVSYALRILAGYGGALVAQKRSRRPFASSA